jgi:hypothetical protein
MVVPAPMTPTIVAVATPGPPTLPPHTAVNEGKTRSVAVNPARDPTACERVDFLVMATIQGALGRTRTCAHGSGGRCSIR